MKFMLVYLVDYNFSLLARIRPRYGILDPQTDQFHPLSAHQGRKGTKKDATFSHAETRQGRLANARRTGEVVQTFKSSSMKSNISLEIAEKDSEVVKPLPPPLVRNLVHTYLIIISPQ